MARYNLTLIITKACYVHSLRVQCSTKLSDKAAKFSCYRSNSSSNAFMTANDRPGIRLMKLEVHTLQVLTENVQLCKLIDHCDNLLLQTVHPLKGLLWQMCTSQASTMTMLTCACPLSLCADLTLQQQGEAYDICFCHCKICKSILAR